MLMYYVNNIQISKRLPTRTLEIRLKLPEVRNVCSFTPSLTMMKKATYLKNKYRCVIPRINITSICLTVCYMMESSARNKGDS